MRNTIRLCNPKEVKNMDIAGAIVMVVIGIIQLIIGLGLAMGAIYMGIRLLDKLTKGIEEEEELKKGNVAVACLMLGVVIAIALVISGGVAGLTKNLTTIEKGATVVDYLIAIGGGVAQVIFGIIFAVVAIYLAFRIWDRITTRIEEVDELKKGNVAIGIIMAGVIIAVAIVIRAGVSGLAEAFGAAGGT
jgi:uncharacterized membrane protein YjfL (UPF0719 family)